MPERPKRRKNNKNKRKNNKNNRIDITSNNSVPSASDNVSASDNFPSENLASTNAVEQSCDDSKNSTDVTPVDKICSDIGSDIPNENESKQYAVDNISGSILESKDDPEESIEQYVVETPDQNKKQLSKLSNGIKSKSFDNDDSPTIVEIIDEDNSQDSNTTKLPLIDSNNVIISDAEGDVLWQKVDELVNFNVDSDNNHMKGSLSIITIPLNIAQCNQTKSLSSEEELSLREYLKSLNLSTNPEYASTSEIKSEIEQVINREIKHRLRKRGLAEDNFVPRVGPSRSLALDVIDEEGSSESSMTSRRQSSLIDKKSDNEELEDEVFETKTVQFCKNKINNLNERSISSRVIPQECIRVDAKIKEPDVTEARGSWTTKTVEKITGAELVYLTDSSSSTSSVYDVNEDNDNSEDSDRSVRIITPTIEVTDTEKLLRDLSKSKENENITVNDLKVSPVNEEVLEITKNESDKEQKNHEIVVESTENIKTDLFVKELKQEKDSSTEVLNEIALQRSPKAVDKYDLEIKVLKCELNDAINNLIKEVSSDSESIKECSNDLLTRQDSSSSVGSSQCTAKYNPTHASLNDVSGIVHESSDNVSGLSSHVKDVLDHVPESHTKSNAECSNIKPYSLRDICLQKISSLPYGEKILEELAEVSTRLQYLSALSLNPISPTFNASAKPNDTIDHYQSKDQLLEKKESVSRTVYTPPPLLPRRSSLKKSQDDKKPKVPPKPDNIHKCLSPSQKTLMENNSTIFTKESIKSTNNVNDKGHNKIDVKVLSSNNRLNDPPFKSQTGSRLLSLICDSSINNNISSSLLKSYNDKRLDNNTPKDKKTNTFSNFRSISEYSSSRNLFSPPKHNIFSPSFYQSDQSSGYYTGNFYDNIQNERKYFHYSTGNLNSEIEDDISSIQNMHRYCSNLRNEKIKEVCPRRPSLPKDLCEQQMEYIRQKEKEVDAEIRRLEEEKESSTSKKGPKAPMITDSNFTKEMTSFQTYKTSKQSGKLSSLFSSSEEELRREKMYTEYVNQMAEREFRKEHKIIKITKPTSTAKSKTISQSMPSLDPLDTKVNNRIEREFITKARERWDKLGIKEPEDEDNNTKCDLYREPKIIEHKIKVIEAGEEKDVNNLPNHLQDFVKFTATGKEQETEGTGECEPGKPPTHVVILCAVIILMLTVGKYFLRLIRNTQ